MWNKNEQDGKVDQAKGKVKQVIGTLMNDDKLKAEGQHDETVGKIEKAVGKTTHKVEDAIAGVAKAVKGENTAH